MLPESVSGFYRNMQLYGCSQLKYNIYAVTIAQFIFQKSSASLDWNGALSIYFSFPLFLKLVRNPYKLLLGPMLCFNMLEPLLSRS